MRTRTHARFLFGTLLAILALSVACKKPAPVAPPPPPPPVAAPPASPTVNLQASPTSIQRGASVTLTWSSTNATTLSLSPGVGNVSAQGTQQVSPTDSITYTLTAPDGTVLQRVTTPNSTGTDPGAAILTAIAPAAGLYEIDVQMGAAMSGKEFTQLVQGTVTETGS